MHFFIVLLILHIVAPLVAVLSDMAFGGRQRPLHGWLIMYLIIFYKAAAINLALFLSVPLLVLLLITGPGGFLGFVVSVVGLGLYVVENIIGYNIPNYSFHGTDQEAVYMIGLLILSVAAFTLAWKLYEANVMDRFSGWLGDQFRRPLIRLEQRLEKTELG